jgi:radical SAM protein with 4Fe4S-binding SPASM domain
MLIFVFAEEKWKEDGLLQSLSWLQGNPSVTETLEIQRLPLWDKLRAKRAPISFDLEITARCNNDCRHCYINLPAGNGSLTVSCDGRFRLCASLWAPRTTYDLRAGSLAEAWHEFVPKVRDLRSQRREFRETCRKCGLVNLCLWCPAHAHLETGEPGGWTPYFCQVARLRAENVIGSGGITQEGPFSSDG